MNRLKLIYLAIILLFPFIVYSCGDGEKLNPPRAAEVSKNEPVQIDFDENSVIFGFSDESGKNILTIDDSLPDPDIYTKTISEDGSLIPVTFVTRKEGTAGKDFQLTYHNFPNCGGYLFKCGEKNVNHEETVVLMTNEFLSGRNFLGIPPVLTNDLNADIGDKISEVKHRKIKKPFPLVKLGNSGELYLVNFEVVNDTAMYSLVLVQPGRLAFQDNPAYYEPAGTWRVDDGGIVNASMFRVLGQFSSKYGIEFVLDWIGTEGFFTQYIIEHGDQLEMVTNGYRYTLPQ